MDPNGLALDAFVLEGGGAALRGVRHARRVAQPPTVTLSLGESVAPSGEVAVSVTV